MTIDTLRIIHNPADLPVNVPPDLYSRNWWIRQIIDCMMAPAAQVTLLDVGGNGGCLSEFLPTARVTVLDLEPGHGTDVIANATALPFQDSAYKVVCCADTLEHIEESLRERALGELFRVAAELVIVACPFDTTGVTTAEDTIQEFHRHATGGVSHRWLAEHVRFGLPSRERFERILAQHGYEFRCFPSNYLPNWLLMQFLIFLNMFDLGKALEKFFSVYNQNLVGYGDACEPAYRHVYAIAVGRKALSPLRPLELFAEAIRQEAGRPDQTALWNQVFTTLAEALCEKNETRTHELSVLHHAREELLQREMSLQAHLQEASQRTARYQKGLDRAGRQIIDLRRQLEVYRREYDAAQTALGEMHGQLANAQSTIERHEAFIHHQHLQLLAKQGEVDAIKGSHYWRVGKPLRFSADVTKAAIRLIRTLPQFPYRPAWNLIRRGGVSTVYQVARDYMQIILRGADVGPVPKGRKAVLFLSGCPGDAKRYRCDHQAEQLHLLGATCDVGTYDQIDLGDILDHYQCFVLHRVPYGPDVQQFILRARSQGKPVIFDTDDWVFDLAAVPHVAALDTMTEDERVLFLDGLTRYRKTLLACDAIMVTTGRLRDLASEIHSNVFVCPNAVSQQMVEQADAALLKKSVYERKDRVREEVTIAYLSGTPTHNRDFLEAADAVLWALETYPTVKFQAVGQIELDARFARFGKRVERIPLQLWQHLPTILAQVDINLAPLEQGNPFTDCKSCIKYIEAGLLGVPTITSPRIDFRRVIDPGRNGLFADKPQEWQQALQCLIESPKLRQEMGRRAYEDVRRKHISRALAPALYETMQTIGGAMKKSDPLTVNWILRAPIAGTGGGYRTIFRLADYLASCGHVVRMYVEPIAHLAHLSAHEINLFLEEHFGPLRVEVFVGHEHILPADASIATNWPTAYRIAEHSESLFKFYFIQDFEPEFYEMDDPLYGQAERTYSLPLHHVCIGRYLGNRIRRLTGKPTDVIDFAVDLDTFHMSIRPEDRPTPITVLFFARPSLKRRGYELGVKALRLLKEQHPNVEILFFGAKPEDLKEVPFDFHNLGVLTPDELCEILNRAHILLSFSLSNISWVPYEGMACGCAVVEAKVPSVVEMVSPGHNCLLADPDPQAVAAALERLVDDTMFRCQLANQAVEDLRDRSWQRSAGQFEEILRQRCFVRLAR